MKANIPVIQLTKIRSKKDVERDQRIAEYYFNKFVEKDQNKVDRRFKKLFAFCLQLDDDMAKTYGIKGWSDPWGKKRIQKLLDMVETVSDYMDKHDEICWTHIDKRLEQIGVEFEKE